MEVVFAHCAGLDVHKQTIVACVPLATAEGRQSLVKSFRTTTAELEAMAAWLHRQGVTHVAMESTGVYWKPAFNILVPSFAVWIVNARELKQVPGRKSDMKDAEWIAQLMSYGLLKRSFIPAEAQRDLRDLTRYRSRLVGERTAAVNRLQKVLEDANIKLASVASDVRGVSARQMLEAMIAGETDATKLAELAQGRLRKRIPALKAALSGRIREHHRFLWGELLEQIDSLNERIQALEERIEQATAPYAPLIERLDAIPGVNRITAEGILAEIGPDVKAFPTAKHLASWACLCPGLDISANKRRSGRTRKGQKWLRTLLVEAAWSAARTKDTYLSAQFHRLRARRGERRVAVAVAHSILGIVYHLMASPEAEFQELGGDYLLKRNQEQEQRRAIRKLESLGYSVSLTPLAA